ncbi:hypothetical protein NDU88_007400 [Pleurodeles waltl]|uniref:Uncharacterized protein n=1 Tax=Pleurodeles waltl TaxID=8319 RepID=A0AAV7U0K1_PLEWA|nr:hypothetical protein NDU88_007400 [Pleurodeles waltl]
MAVPVDSEYERYLEPKAGGGDIILWKYYFTHFAKIKKLKPTIEMRLTKASRLRPGCFLSGCAVAYTLRPIKGVALFKLLAGTSRDSSPVYKKFSMKNDAAVYVMWAGEIAQALDWHRDSISAELKTCD